MDGTLDGLAVVDMGALEFQYLTVEIDIKPGAHENPINLKSRGCTLVAILTTDSFNAADVNPNAVRVAEAAPRFTCLWDADWDGDRDLILMFRTSDFKITAQSISMFLIGQTKTGVMVVGEDVIKVVPSPKKRCRRPHRSRRLR